MQPRSTQMPKLRKPAGRAAGLLMALLVLCLLLVNSLAAPSLTTLQEALASERDSVEQNSALAEEQKTQLLAKLDEAVQLVEEAQDLEERRQALAQRLADAPEELQKLRASFEEPGIGLRVEDIEAWNLNQLEVVLKEREIRLGEIELELAAHENQLNEYLLLARNGSAEITQLQSRLSEASGAQAGAGSDSVDGLLRQARREKDRARLDWLVLQQSNLNQLIELAQTKRDLIAAREQGLREHLAAYRDYWQQRREQAAAIAQLAAQQASLEAPTSLGGLRRQVAELAEEQSLLVTREFELDRVTEHAKRRIEEVTRDRQRLQQIVELGGASAQVSSLLQKRRAFTAPPNELTQQVIDYQQQLSDAALRQIELDERLRATADSAAELERVLQAVSPEERAGLRDQALEALSRQRELSLELWKHYTRIITKLSSLEALTRQRLEVITDYRSFIDDRLLWMPSTEISPLDQPGLLYGALSWLLSPENLAILAKDAWQLPRQSTVVLVLWLLGLVAILALRRWAKQNLEVSSQAVQRPRSDRFSLTLFALLGTLVLVLPWPWLFIGAGLLLGIHGQDYTQIIAAGMQAAGHTLLLLLLVAQLCREKGVARDHLGWNEVLCSQLGGQALWLSSIATPLAFFAVLGSATVPSAFVQLSSPLQIEVAGLGSIGLIAAVSLLVVLAFSIYHVWKRHGRVMQEIAADNGSSKWADYHLVWFYPLLLVPLMLSVIAISGFFYTSVFLMGKVAETVWFLFLLVLARDLLLRGLYAAQRRLRFEEALRYREETALAAAEKPVELPIETTKPNYAELGEKVSQLMRMLYMISLLLGLWWIWRDIVPALNIFDSVKLPLSTEKLVDGVSQEVPLTLGDMLAGLLLGGLALFAARNIPALLELTLLQRLPLSRASRYAITTLTQYVVAMLGLVITFNALGLQWSSIQWLVAALSVGLGFGLQEIVANFISGIILLFEQPIRVGDVVTVENTTGTVSRIRIRATTIINWERQELVIPNKSFITGTLINWTLSDTVNRVIITVGVGYGSDTKQAMEIMRQIAIEHPDILDDPAPRITFELFGDNSLNLLMRGYLNDIDKRLTVITELHQEILERFREAGIEIAFPQRDVHLDTSRPLEFVLRKDAREEAASGV